MEDPGHVPAALRDRLQAVLRNGLSTAGEEHAVQVAEIAAVLHEAFGGRG